jgi:hypothetical protein
MPLHSLIAILQVLRTSAVFLAVAAYARPLYLSGAFDGAAGSVLAAKVTFALIGLQVLVGGVTAGLAAAYGALRGDPDRIDHLDERDRLFDLRALKVFLTVFGAGFVATMAAMWLGLPLILAFAGLVLSMHLGDIAANLTKILLYRRGF